MAKDVPLVETHGRHGPIIFRLSVVLFTFHLLLLIIFGLYYLSVDSTGSMSENAPVAFNESTICGRQWQSEYLKIHSEIMRSKTDKKLLIFSSCTSCGGLGDRFTGMVSVFLLSILFKRAFLIEWENLAHTSALEPATFDWRLNPDTLRGYPEPYWYKGCPRNATSDYISVNFLNPGYYPTAFYEKFYKCLERLQNVSVIKIRSNRGFSYISSVRDWEWKAKIEELGFKPPYIFGCLLRFLIRIPDRIQEKAEPYLTELKKPGRLSIGIHSRPGHADKVFDSTWKVPERFINATQILFNCAETLSSFKGRHVTDTRYFMMSPSTYLKNAFKEKYGDMVILANVTARHMETSLDSFAATEVMMEWFIFTQCDFFVFHESGLSSTAAMYSLRPNVYFKIYANSSDEKCDPKFPSSITDLATQWSGL